MVLRVEKESVLWATTALKTITSEHRNLREIIIYVNFLTTLDLSPLHTQWTDLDRVLVQLCKLDAVRVRVSYQPSWKREELREYAEGLLLEMSKEEIPGWWLTLTFAGLRYTVRRLSTLCMLLTKAERGI